MPIEGNHFCKRLSPRERAEPEAVARLRAEARLLALLGETGIVPRFVDEGEDRQGPWLRMERVAIPTLGERIERAEPIDAEWIERAVLATYRTLALLHEAHDGEGPLAIVHADLSPANIAIDDLGARATILDFDLTWWREGPPREDGAFRGTIGYVAPEIARGERPTQEADLFSLAASLLHAATGKTPRPTDGSLPFAALLAMAAERPILDARHDFLAGSGRGHTAIARCLAHEPAARPGSARAVLALLGVC